MDFATEHEDQQRHSYIDMCFWYDVGRVAILFDLLFVLNPMSYDELNCAARTEPEVLWQGPSIGGLGAVL